MKKATLTLLALVLASSLAAKAQSTQTWIGQGGSGGDGTWDVGTTADWNGPSTWTNGNDASFTETPGSIAVEDGVVASQLYFGSGAGNWIFTGSEITATGNDTLNVASGNSSNVTFNNGISGFSEIENYGTGILTLNGNFSGTTNFDAGAAGANGAGSIVINGSESLPGGEVDFGYQGGSASAQYVIGPNASFSGVQYFVVGNGAVLLQTGNIGNTIFAVPDNSGVGVSSILTDGAIDYSGPIHERINDDLTIGGATADLSSFTGFLQNDNDGELGVTAAAGGRVTLAITVVDELGGANGLVKTGAGTAVIAGPSGRGLSYRIAGTVTADLQAGTTLANNTSNGSAFGNSTGTVNVENNATLGGTGSVSQTVIAEGAGSILTAGDPGQSNLGISAQIGTLTLGSIEAADGLTLDFKLNGLGDVHGTNNDFIDVKGTFSLGGNVTVNLTSLDGSVVTGQEYLLMAGNGGSWSEAPGTNFDFIAPTGYTVESYDFNTDDDAEFGVTFAAAPEPSTYAMLLGGLGLLAVVGRLRRLVRL
jgi:hypothetical protein